MLEGKIHLHVLGSLWDIKLARISIIAKEEFSIIPTVMLKMCEGL